MSEFFERIMKWAGLKILLNEKEHLTRGREREVWWVHLGVNVRDEEDGKHEDFERPALIVSTFFGGRILWVIPMTTSGKEGNYYFKSAYKNERGFPVTQYAIIPQLRAISHRRLRRKMRVMPKDEFDSLSQRIITFLPK